MKLKEQIKVMLKKMELKRLYFTNHRHGVTDICDSLEQSTKKLNYKKTKRRKATTVIIW